jgi:hypothetical protein
MGRPNEDSLYIQKYFLLLPVATFYRDLTKEITIPGRKACRNV